MVNMELRTCLTKECNFKCKYCRPGGEGAYNENNPLTKEELSCIIQKLTNFGVSSVRFTGGEPLLRADFIEVAAEINKIDAIKSISLVTNGSNLNEELVTKMKQCNFREVTVSLDTLDPKKFKELSGVDCLNRVVNGIKLLRKYDIATRINTVVTKTNFSDIHDLLEFCNQNKVSLKLLDLVKNDHDYWEKEFTPLKSVRKEMSEIASEKDIGYANVNRLGTPMDKFNIGSTEVFIKDNTIGTCYSDICNECELYPCQSGIVSLVLTHDGFLKICSCSNKFNLDLRPLINDDRDTYEKLEKIINKYINSQYKDAWYKTLKEKKEEK